MTKLGNTELLQYGIYEEEVDLRIHIAYKVKKIYIYEREEAIKILQHHPTRSSYQEVNGAKTETARGHIVPVEIGLFGIQGLIDINIRKSILEKNWCEQTDDESIKGERAVNIVREMLEKGVIQLYLPEQFKVRAKHEGDLDMQLKGKDIILIPEQPSIQVKCDYMAGSRALGGTGNLYIQTHECNPHGKH
ncbi:hypothetical protein LCGC14_1919450 [marine sediment metagenome]|uniref:Uncharacterized protein n=1 Tax=marine sediment metagenome TaxID=412755 RepID=A0A0F9FR23_9ZZZZ